LSGAAAPPAVVALHAGFFLTGVVTVLLGPLIPELQAQSALSPSQGGGLFVAQFVASSVGAVLSTRRIRASLLAGYGFMALGLACLTAGRWPLPLGALALVGLGLGLSIPATNVLVAGAARERRAAALSTLNFTWGAGAVSCPLLFAALLERVPAAAALWLLAGLAACSALGLARVTAGAPSGAGAAPAPAAPGPARLLLPGLLAVELFLYVGSESSLSGWLAALSDQLGGRRAAASLIISSGFWAALLAGRALAPLLLRRVGAPGLHVASLALALAGALTLLGARSRGMLALGALAAGAGHAALFPLTVAVLTAYAEKTGWRGAGWVFAIGGLGGAALPWLSGHLAQAFGGLRAGFVVPVAALVLMAALYPGTRSAARLC
jgi:fucose permease